MQYLFLLTDYILTSILAQFNQSKTCTAALLREIHMITHTKANLDGGSIDLILLCSLACWSRRCTRALHCRSILHNMRTSHLLSHLLTRCVPALRTVKRLPVLLHFCSVLFVFASTLAQFSLHLGPLPTTGFLVGPFLQ
jgi:hypothetical protein